MRFLSFRLLSLLLVVVDEWGLVWHPNLRGVLSHLVVSMNRRWRRLSSLIQRLVLMQVARFLVLVHIFEVLWRKLGVLVDTHAVELRRWL